MAGRYRSYGRQDAQTSLGLGPYLRRLAGLLDAEDLAGQRAVIPLALQYLGGAYLSVLMTLERRQEIGSTAELERQRDVIYQVLPLLAGLLDRQGDSSEQES